MYFFIDDSGVLHRNEKSGHFVYAGYVFTDRETVEEARHKYINVNQKIRSEHNIKGELKAAMLENKHRRALFNSVREYDSFSVVVDISRVYDNILDQKKAICRYKDYILKRIIKYKLLELIKKGIISREEDVCIIIQIDNQLTATNGYYGLRESIVEELQHGIANFDYGIRHPAVFDSSVEVHIKYCDSKNNYLIQACDILANRIWSSYKKDDPLLRNIENHINLELP